MKKNKTEYVVPKGMRKSKMKSALKSIPRKIKFYFSMHRFARLLAILFVILCVVYAVKSVILNLRYQNLASNIMIQDMDEYMISQKDIPSDINGMSVYDKYTMGLDYREGSDTDHDGLTDKEEIEVYNTDPLKASSSGDLYTDGYKVSNGMDISRNYNYSNDREFLSNDCKEISLKAACAEDFNAVIEDCTDRYSLENWGIDKVYKGYFLYNFSGQISIDLTDILSSNSLEISDINVWIAKGAFLIDGLTDLEKCDYTVSENQIAINQDLEYSSHYYIFITSEKTLFNSLFAKKNDDKLQVNNAGTSSYKVLEVMAFGNITVYYPEQDTPEAEEQLITELGKRFSADISFKKASKVEMQLKYKTYYSIVPFLSGEELNKRFDKAGNGLWENAIIAVPAWIFSYGYDDVNNPIFGSANSTTNSGDFEQVAYNNYHTSFDPYKDELPFQNFGSKYNKSGNCAGIAYLTSYLYNQGTFPSNGNYGDITWNLTTDKDNATLMDAGLEDYKDKSFIDKNSGWNDVFIDDGLTSGEREFVKMIGAAWKETNDTFSFNDYLIDNQHGISWDNAEAIINRLDQGKIVTIGLAMKNGGHMMNIYDYYYVNNNEVLFRVYDNNIPQNHMDNYHLNCDGACYLQCKKVLNENGSYNMLYIYYPVAGDDDYIASSDPDLSQRSALVITDETLTLYNTNH